MTQQLAHDYIRRRMGELGHDSYHMRFRHFVLAPHEVRKIDAPLQLLVLTDPKECIRIQSVSGVFDLCDTSVNELQYEHRDSITLTSYSPLPQHVTMIQVTFKKK